MIGKTHVAAALSLEIDRIATKYTVSVFHFVPAIL
jgi:hypothetical protein